MIDLLAALPRVALGINGYNEQARAADFMLVFSSEAGQRVLSQIGAICDPLVRDSDLNNHGQLAAKEGRRQVLQEIQRCFVVKAPMSIEERPDPRDAETYVRQEGGFET